MFEAVDSSLSNLDSSLWFIQPSISHDALSAYKLNEQGDNIQPCHAPFPIWNQSVFPCPFLTCFLIHIQVSQETGKVIWHYHLLKNFPQFAVIQTVKGFSRVNETEVDVFLEFPCFHYDSTKLAIWSYFCLELIVAIYRIALWAAELAFPVWDFMFFHFAMQ